MERKYSMEESEDIPKKSLPKNMWPYYNISLIRRRDVTLDDK